MKKYLFILATFMLFTSCEKDLSISDSEKVVLQKQVIQNCETSKDFAVPLQKDAVTVIVSDNGDTLAITSTPMTIKIPKSATAVTTRLNEDYIAQGFKISYITPNSFDYEALSKRTYCAAWQAIMFEDSENGDYDYNDLILHVYTHTDLPWQKGIAVQSIDIQPIALGSQKMIGFGCVLSDGSIHYITHDVRSHYYGDYPSFINTVDGQKPFRSIRSIGEVSKHELAIRQDKSYWVAWFIFVDGDYNKKYYAVSGDIPYKDYNDVLDKNMLPYGLAISDDNGTFKYPLEKESIKAVYPGFMDWAVRGASNIGKPNLEKVYPLSHLRLMTGLDGSKCNIWDYQDLEKTRE